MDKFIFWLAFMLVVLIGAGSVVFFFISSYKIWLGFHNSPKVLSEITVWYGMAVVSLIVIVIAIILGCLLKLVETSDSTQ